jgi:hypothetical protein
MVSSEEIGLVHPTGFPWTVTNVFVNGPKLADNAAWHAAAGADAAFGYPIPDGFRQLRPLPWNTGINSVSIRFNVDAGFVLDGTALIVRGSAGPIATNGFAYDNATRTGTWGLASVVMSDKLRVVLDDAVFHGGLDGEWRNPSNDSPAGDTFPSGNGEDGGDFDFRINVLRGDSNGDGVVNGLDLADAKKRLTRKPGDGVIGSGAYSIFADLNTDGVINALDVAAVKGRLNTRINTLPDPVTALLFA